MAPARHAKGKAFPSFIVQLLDGIGTLHPPAGGPARTAKLRRYQK
jgi:hypothetical protein